MCNLKNRVKEWPENEPIDFPETNNIENDLNCCMNDLIIWKGKELTSIYLRSINEDLRDEIAKDIFNFFSKYDFTRLNYSKEILKKDYKRLMSSDLEIETIDGIKYISNINSSGNTVCKKFIPNVLEISTRKNPSVLETLNDKEKLFKIIRNRVGNTFLYTEKKGEEKLQWPFNITPAMMVQGSRSIGYAAHGSMFKPLVAKAIYKKYAPYGGKVYDFSAGFGGRLLGAYAAKKNLKYYGTEPNTKTYNNLLKFNDKLKFNATIYNKCSEDLIIDEKMDLIFSSPPYFDHEIYCNESTQSCSKFPSYNDWLEKYWRETVKNIKKMCSSKTIFAVNAGNANNKKMNKIHDDMVSIICDEGFVEFDRIYMKTSKSHFSKNKNKKKEPICFFKLAKKGL